MSATTALEKVKKNAESFALEMVQENQSQSDKKEVFLALGAIGGMRLVSRFIGASNIKVLQQIRDQDKFKALGYTRFDEFMDNEPLVESYIGISYKTFNKLENQLEKEGEEIYELLNNFRIPLSTRKLLTDGDVQISLNGDEVQIGEEVVNLNESPDLKKVFKELAKETKRLVEEKQSHQQKVKTLQEQIKSGFAEKEELQRAMDAQSEGTKYEQSLAKAIAALINLKNEAESLPLMETQRRGRGDVESLWQQMLLVRSALYQDDFAFVEAKADKKGISKRAMQVLAESDDFGDEDEQ